MRISRKMSVAFWVNRLTKALDVAYASPKMKAKLERLHQQHNSIRAWQLGNGDSAKHTDGNGFHLLP